MRKPRWVEARQPAWPGGFKSMTPLPCIPQPQSVDHQPEPIRPNRVEGVSPPPSPPLPQIYDWLIEDSGRDPPESRASAVSV